MFSRVICCTAAAAKTNPLVSKKNDEPLTPIFEGEITIFSSWKLLFWVPVTPSHTYTPTPTYSIKINLVIDFYFKCSFYNIFFFRNLKRKSITRVKKKKTRGNYPISGNHTQKKFSKWFHFKFSFYNFFKKLKRN